MEWIRIPIPVSLFEDQDPNLKGMDLNLESRKGRKKVCLKKWIQILMERIRIWILVSLLWWLDSNLHLIVLNH